MPEIIQLLHEDEDHKLLEEMFKYFEEVVHYGGLNLVSNFKVTVLEILGNGKVIKRCMLLI